MAVATLSLFLFQCQHKSTTTRGWSIIYKSLKGPQRLHITVALMDLQHVGEPVFLQIQEDPDRIYLPHRSEAFLKHPVSLNLLAAGQGFMPQINSLVKCLLSSLTSQTWTQHWPKDSELIATVWIP